jgi:protein phosphatase 1 regulatory subunit 7
VHRRLADLTTIDESEVVNLLGAGDDVILQYSGAIYSQALLERINSLCERYGERVEVRFYGHRFDFAQLRHLPAVEALTVDCLEVADNIEMLGKLEHLKRLTLGIFRLDAPLILQLPSLRGLTDLSIGATKKRNIDLAPLAAMKHLRAVTVVGHARSIEALAEVSTLDSLTLWQLASSVRLDFVGAIEQLRRLRLALGGRANVDEIQHPRLRSLEVVRVRGFSTLSPSSFPGLVDLLIEDQLGLVSLTFSDANRCLERILLLNCKSLRSLTGLAGLANLRTLRISRTAIPFEELLGRGLPPTLKTLAFYTGRSAQDRAIRQQLQERGFDEFGGRE